MKPAARVLSIVGLALLLASWWSPAYAMGAVQPALIYHDTAAYTYDTAAYVYDAPALLSSPLSSPDTLASYVRGSPPGPVAASWATSSPPRDRGVAANTAGRAAASSTARVGPGASLENISASEALRIQNAANRIGEPISLVGSRASGTAGAYSDWDYVITGINGSTRHSVSSSLPRGATELGVGCQIDIFTGPLDDTLPHITFFPSGG